MTKIIEFEAYNGECVISGFMDLQDMGEEAPLQFYNNNGSENDYTYPANPFDESTDKTYYSFEQLKEAMQTDDKLIQYLMDYQDKSDCIQRDGYELRINGSSETSFAYSGKTH